MTAIPLLTVSSLQKSFGGVEAVKDVSFEVRPGQLLALIGPNGAGKSTTFNCLNGQLKPDSGTVWLKDKNIAGMAPHKIWRMGVGRTFQITATFLSMSVIENVQMALINHNKGLWSFFRRARKQHEPRALELLAMVGLAEQADTACSTLAYGDLKRLELAVALANDPVLLLMDEPTAGMGAEERTDLMNLTHKIAKAQDIGVLFTEHDMDAVFTHADHIVVMHRGAVIAEGDAAAVQGDKTVKEVYLGNTGSKSE